jgi:hypothetical protein
VVSERSNLIHWELSTMKAVTPMQGAVPADHCQHLEPSPQPTDGEADATLGHKTPQTTGANVPEFSDLKAFIEYLEQLPPGTRTKEEIDLHVAQERASWD